LIAVAGKLKTATKAVVNSENFISWFL